MYHLSDAWEVQYQDTSWFSAWWGSTSWFIDRLFVTVYLGRKEEVVLRSIFFFFFFLIRVLVPFMRAPSSWPSHFPKIQAPNTFTVEIQFQHRDGQEAHKKMLSSVQALSPIQLFVTPMDCSTPGLPVHQQLPELTQTDVHWVSDAIQPSHPLSSPSTPTFNLSQNQGLFQSVHYLHQVAKVLEFQLQHQSYQWIFRTDFL